MENIKVNRYSNTETRQHWLGWIEPESGAWVLFVAADGGAVLLRRESGELVAV